MKLKNILKKNTTADNFSLAKWRVKVNWKFVLRNLQKLIELVFLYKLANKNWL